MLCLSSANGNGGSVVDVSAWRLLLTCLALCICMRRSRRYRWQRSRSRRRRRRRSWSQSQSKSRRLPGLGMYEHAWHTLYRFVLHVATRTLARINCCTSIHTHIHTYIHTYRYLYHIFWSRAAGVIPISALYSLLAFISFFSLFFSRILFSTFTLKRFFRFAASFEVALDNLTRILWLYPSSARHRVYQLCDDVCMNVSHAATRRARELKFRMQVIECYTQLKFVLYFLYHGPCSREIII